MKTPIAFDIETVPNVSMVERLPKPEVKYGRTTDPDKRAEMDSAAREKQVDKMALNPLYGRVCAYALFGNTQKSGVVSRVDDKAEVELIENILYELGHIPVSGSVVITWNGYQFDFPFVFKRAAILGIELPSRTMNMSYWCCRYKHWPHCDLMQELAGWGRDYSSLDSVALAVLGTGKTERDYSKYCEMIENGQGSQIESDCICDAEITNGLYNRFAKYLFKED